MPTVSGRAELAKQVERQKEAARRLSLVADIIKDPENSPLRRVIRGIISGEVLSPETDFMLALLVDIVLGDKGDRD